MRKKLVICITIAMISLIAFITSAQTTCPEGCSCLTEENAKNLGYAYCQKEKILCGYDQFKNPMYCYQPTLTSVQCPVNCSCLTQDEAKKLNYILCNNKTI
ncbi:MAG: hypothetical protein NZ872_03430, partial [Archaeoglobaceae archaeon]|nr:hypothetical protein [Archaeoglobaceae archaeon]MDW8128250.1 hypothetical protein [Archaeoglobaceae archaeon]